MPTFRLDQQPWISVVGTDGSVRIINLIEVFTEAGKISEITGSPLEIAAITRFLLAIAHLTETPITLNEWGKLWQNRAIYMCQCAEYVKFQSDAWDLFGEQYPFGQLPAMDKTLNPAHILVYEAARKNNAVFTDHNIVASPISIPAAALIRGIFTTNAYAGSSGGGYLSGPLAMRTVAMLHGHTLDETLLLNLLVQKKVPPAYEWKTYGHPWKNGTEINLVQRYLWTSRRIRLLADKSGCAAKEIYLAPGDKMPESDQKEDSMIVMHKDSKKKDYEPLSLNANCALWRSAHVLLNWNEDTKPLATVDQLHRLLRRELISADQPVYMRVCAIAGKAKGPSSELWRDESLPFGLSVIMDENRFAAVSRAVNTAEEISNATRKRIRSFAARYLQNGTETKPDMKDINKLLDELSLNLTDFWSAIAPIGERIACDRFDEQAWNDLLKKSAEKTFRHAIDRLPPDARRYRAEFQRFTGGDG